MLCTTMKVNECHADSIAKLMDCCTEAEVAFNLSVRKIRDRAEDLWAAIHELYPETKDYNCAMEKNPLRIVILSRKESPDK